MKKIFVTVAEFLENGGILKSEVQLYKKNHAKTYPETLGWYVDRATHDDMIMIGNIGKTFPYYSNQAFIEIDCTPIYK
jgi:hypothetical protein